MIRGGEGGGGQLGVLDIGVQEGVDWWSLCKVGESRLLCWGCSSVRGGRRL